MSMSSAVLPVVSVVRVSCLSILQFFPRATNSREILIKVTLAGIKLTGGIRYISW